MKFSSLLSVPQSPLAFPQASTQKLSTSTWFYFILCTNPGDTAIANPGLGGTVGRFCPAHRQACTWRLADAALIKYLLGVRMGPETVCFQEADGVFPLADTELLLNNTWASS